jgi:hypothetical protein
VGLTLTVNVPARVSLPDQSNVLAFDLADVPVPLPTISTYVPFDVVPLEEGSCVLYSPNTCCDLFFAIVPKPSV